MTEPVFQFFLSQFENRTPKRGLRAPVRGAITERVSEASGGRIQVATPPRGSGPEEK